MRVDFEKVLKEKLSPETFALISADEQVFGKWIENLRDAAEQCGELAVRMERMNLSSLPPYMRMEQYEKRIVVGFGKI